MMKCERCQVEILSLSPMRRWCFECRKKISIEQARKRRLKKRAQIQVIRQ